MIAHTMDTLSFALEAAPNTAFFVVASVYQLNVPCAEKLRYL